MICTRFHAAVARRLCLYAFVCLLAFASVAVSATGEDMTSTWVIGGSRIDVTIESADWKISQADLMHWVQSAGEAVATYYGKYPVPHLVLRIAAFDGNGVRHGMTWGRDGGGLIKIGVGNRTTRAELEEDWMLTNEMVHLSFPSMADEHHWIEEGIATYVEPIARVRAKHLDAHEMWFELVRDLHQGLPQAGDEGLDNTHTWGRTYWGGALFCFLADVEIHKQTNNRKGLDDALRGILSAGGDIRYDWPLEQALKIGDEATGVPVLVPLFQKMKNQPYDVDLSAMWKELGVERDGNTVQFIDSAPLAKTRDAITFGVSTAGKLQPASASPVILAGRRSR